MRLPIFLACLLLPAVATAKSDRPAHGHPRPSPTILSIVGTSDLHGHLDALPTFSGYLQNLRAIRNTDGATLLLDAGDMFQGTLESNLSEGEPVVEAYNALGYTAVAIGNHEFDFGPVGPSPSPQKPGDDPRGALRARAAQAKFPFLAANVVVAATGQPPAWKNITGTHLVKLGDLTVGIVGVVTPAAGKTSLPANVKDLRFLPLAPTIAAAAQNLRQQGATVIIAVAHEGGGCQDFAAPDDLTSCAVDSEIFQMARALPPGAVDVIVAGHAHQAIAKVVAGIPIIESYANGRAFGRVDLAIDPKRHTVQAHTVFAPRDICAAREGDCQPGDYEGQPVLPDESLRARLAPAYARAKDKGKESLGIDVTAFLPHNRSRETALGNWLVDRMRETQPGADVAMMNGGGLRAGFPAGKLTFARLYEAFPFDNAFASFPLPAGELRKRFARAFDRGSSQMSIAGLRIVGKCKDQRLELAFLKPDGTPVANDTVLRVLTTDYLASGGDGFFGELTVPVEIGPPVRDAVAEMARQRGGTLDPADPALFDPQHPRIDLPRPVPVRCGGENKSP